MYVRRRSNTWRIKFFIVGSLILIGVIVYLILHTEPFEQRLEAISFYTRTYLNKIRPNVQLPAPPEVSDISPEMLLSATGSTSSGDTPAYFNDETLNPTQAGSAETNAVRLVESNALALAPIASQVSLGGITHQWQTWNNCGPSTITMNLSYFGRTETQVDSAQFLKPNQEDKNVNPTELADYARSLGFEAVSRVGGDVELLKLLLSNELPVIVEFWSSPEDNGGLGHYRLFTGYDQAGGYFIAEDSLNGSNVRVPIAQFDSVWQVFNRTYIVVFPPDKIALVNAILGEDMIDSAMVIGALETAQIAATNNPNNAFAWFNIGTNYARLGEAQLAASAFDQARRLGLPYRMLWYQFDIFEAYLAVGRYQEVIDLSSATLQATGGLEELYYYRGLALQATGQRDAANDDFRAALDYNPNFTAAADALAVLETSS